MSVETDLWIGSRKSKSSILVSIVRVFSYEQWRFVVAHVWWAQSRLLYPVVPWRVGGRQSLFRPNVRRYGLDGLSNFYISKVIDGACICVYNLDRVFFGQFLVPDSRSDITFAGSEVKKLIITTFQSVYTLEMQVRGFAS